VKPRDEKKARDILAATLREVEAVGLAGLSMEAVARRAGVATGTLYVYFENKGALVDALYLATKRELAKFAFREEDLPVRVAFTKMCLAFLEYVMNSNAKLVFMAQVANSPYLTEQTKSAAEIGVRPLTLLLERGKREMLLKPLDTELMLAFLYGSLRELAAVVGRAPRSQRAGRSEQSAALCWDALKA
jgi:TetR/AcrR family transcriptional regulator, repressor of fatR-cypB operon